MDNQLFEMLTKRFDSQDETLKEIKDSFKEHLEKDETYWRKIDVQDGQITLLKVLLGSSSLTALITGIWLWFSTKLGIR